MRCKVSSSLNSAKKAKFIELKFGALDKTKSKFIKTKAKTSKNGLNTGFRSKPVLDLPDCNALLFTILLLKLLNW